MILRKKIFIVFFCECQRKGTPKGTPRIVFFFLEFDVKSPI